MISWIDHIHDKDFIGIGPYITCTHCNNAGWMRIWQPYFQQKIYSVIPTPKRHFDFIVICNVCHWGNKIPKKNVQAVANLLKASIESNKRVFDNFDEKQKYHWIKILNRLELKEISSFLCFGDQIAKNAKPIFKD